MKDVVLDGVSLGLPKPQNFSFSARVPGALGGFRYDDGVPPDREGVQCGWLKDKFGRSWQIVPTILAKLMGDKDREKAKRVMQAMLKMKKIEIEGLKRAYAQE
jgi:hypothetical protein